MLQTGGPSDNTQEGSFLLLFLRKTLLACSARVHTCQHAALMLDCLGCSTHMRQDCLGCSPEPLVLTANAA